MSGKNAPAPPPAWSAAYTETPVGIVIATYGAQARDPVDLTEFARWFDAVQNLPSGPRVCERARFLDAADFSNEVFIAYWRDPFVFAEWQQSPAVCDWWDAPERSKGPIGVWREIVTVPSERLETILSAQHVEIGSRRLADGIVGPIETHGYWGSMRNRLPVSRHDPLLSPVGEELPAREQPAGSGRRTVVRPPANLTLIRSGQDAVNCDDDEVQEYLGHIRPVLEKGMNYLRDNAEETGCCSCRFMEEVEPDGSSSARSFGFAWFLTLGHLERWSKSHPTHLAIYNRFSAFAQKRGPSLKLDLWHEVAVVPPDGGMFEYVNCHPHTGLLGYFGDAS